MPSRLRSVAILAVAAVLALIAAACQQAPGPKKAPQTVLVWGGPKNISMVPIIADTKGFFKAEGLDVRPNYLQTGKIAMDAVVSGDLNLGIIVETNIAFVKFQQGADVKVVASLLRKHDDAIIARADQHIRKPKDLEGKSIAIVPGTTSHRFADLFIDFYKLNARKIQFLNQTSPASIQASVLNGSIPAGSVWEPFRYNIQQALGDKVVQFNDRAIYTAYGLLAVRGDFARREPAAIQAFLRALIRAEAFIRDHPDEAIQILGRELSIDPKILSSIWGEYEMNVRLDESLVKVFVSTGEWAKRTQAGFADKPVPAYTDVLDPSFLSGVDPAKVTHAAN